MTKRKKIKNAPRQKEKIIPNNLLENNQSFGMDEAQRELNIFSVKNGLQDALGLPSDGTGFSQLSQTDTLFKNNRWYLISNMRQLLSQIYVEIGLIRTVVDIPVDDALRGGVEISSKQLSEEQITDIQNLMEQQDDLSIAGEAGKWNRLFGGAGLVIISGQDPKTPMNWDAIGSDSPIEFRAVDMWELYFSKQNTKDYSAIIDGRELENVEYYDYYGIQLHKSRVIIMRGDSAPSFVRPRLRGWGVSCVETVVRSINQYLKATDLTFEVLDEFKIDIVKIKGLTMALHSAEGHEAIRKRVALMTAQKNYQNAITMDGEDDYVQKQLSFAGISDTMTGIRMQVASDLKMPLTKVFGISSAGFSSGEDDIENYNATVESGTRTKLRQVILTQIKVRAQQLFGFVPDDITFKYKPLRVLSTEQEENVKTQKYNRALQARQAGEISRLEFREIVNRGNLLDMKLETEGIDDELGKPEELSAPSSTEIPSSKTQAPSTPLSNSYSETAINFKGRKVAVVGIISGNEILTGLRRDDNKWVFPAGHIEVGEDPRDGAIREVFEESGIRLLPTDLKPIDQEIVLDSEGNKIALFSFMASVNKQEATSDNDPDKEVSEWRWVNISPETFELKADNRHAGKNDAIIAHLCETRSEFEKKFWNYLPYFRNKK